MQAPVAEETKKSQGAMDRRKTISALVHDQVNKFHNQQLIIWAKIQLQTLIWILPSLQRKTGGRGEEIDLERQFRVTFENPCRIKQKKMLTQFFHFVFQPRSKIRACEDFQHDVAPWLFLQTDALAVSVSLILRQALFIYMLQDMQEVFIFMCC